MTWEVYYKGFNNWDRKVQLKNISYLTDFGPTHEICEIAKTCINSKVASKLICRAMAIGIRFAADEITQLEGLVDNDLYGNLMKYTVNYAGRGAPVIPTD